MQENVEWLFVVVWEEAADENEKSSDLLFYAGG